MTKEQAEQIARVLGQYHNAFAFVSAAFLSGDQTQTVSEIISKHRLDNEAGLSVFGFAAVAFIYSYDCVAKPLRCAESIFGVRNLRSLGVTLNDTAGRETPQVACMRHLRNCFAHGRFTLTLKRTITWVELSDQNTAGVTTFRARCKTEQVICVAERTLLNAYKMLVSKA